MNIVVTAGGTAEKVDSVRVVTNISSGKLGSMIADTFAMAGHKVTYVAPASAVAPTILMSRKIVTDTASVMESMRHLVPRADVVIHSAAISDFTFNRTKGVKLSSNDSDAFVSMIRDTIVPTPKVINHFRVWNRNAVLVGFKFTVGESKDSLTSIAKGLMMKNDLDIVMANDKARMSRMKEHEGILIMRDWEEVAMGKEAIAKALYKNTMRLAEGRVS